MDFKTFKNMYVTNFISTWAANNYTDACMLGRHERLSSPPIEDAIHLAKEAWKSFFELDLVCTKHLNDEKDVFHGFLDASFA